MNIKRRELGFMALVAVVIGSQIGSGMFFLPSALAPFKMVGFLGWIVSVLGAISLALIFSDLSSHLPKTGGPHVYVSEVFGKTAGFFTGWSYWLISWSSNSVLLVTITKYLTTITGDLSTFQVLVIECSITFLVTCINLVGMRFSGIIETTLISLKVIPLLGLPIIFFTLFNPSFFNISESYMASSGTNMISTISMASLLTFWGFIGVECATTPAGSVSNPKRTVPRALIVGTSCVALIYILNAISIVGVVGFDKLASFSAPYSFVVGKIFGSGSDIAISILAILICFGTLNSWTLTGGQIAYGAYIDGLFPKIFGKTNRFGSPFMALIISAIGCIPFFVLEQLEQGGLDKLIDMLVSIFLYVYMICCFAYLKLLNKWYKTWKEKIRGRALSYFSILFCIFVLSQSIIISFIVLAIFIAIGYPVFLKNKSSIINGESK